MKKKVEVNDPSRIPHLQTPLENDVLRIHKLLTGKMLVDITKELVKMKK